MRPRDARLAAATKAGVAFEFSKDMDVRAIDWLAMAAKAGVAQLGEPEMGEAQLRPGERRTGMSGRVALEF